MWQWLMNLPPEMKCAAVAVMVVLIVVLLFVGKK